LKDVVRFHVGERSRLARTKADVDRFGSIWKEVAEAHLENGASYAFAAATCKKRWMIEVGIAVNAKNKKGKAARAKVMHRNRVSISTASSGETAGQSSTLGGSEDSSETFGRSDIDEMGCI
jgi:hypothetical protein